MNGCVCVCVFVFVCVFVSYILPLLLYVMLLIGGALTHCICFFRSGGLGSTGVFLLDTATGACVLKAAKFAFREMFCHALFKRMGILTPDLICK